MEMDQYMTPSYQDDNDWGEAYQDDGGWDAWESQGNQGVPDLPMLSKKKSVMDDVALCIREQDIPERQKNII
jgi:hypothetical protein